MAYFDEIRELTKLIPTSIVDFSKPRTKPTTPTQASSEFIINKEQGDWAEDLIFKAINATSNNYIAVRYGKSDDLIAGEEGFKKFFEDFQNELDTIGKRPDLLIFKKDDFNENFGYNLSNLDHLQIEEYVKKAIAGLEIRSSAFLINKYEQQTDEIKSLNIKKALDIKERIISECPNIIENLKKKPKSTLAQNLEQYMEFFKTINKDNISYIDYSNKFIAKKEFGKLSEDFKELRELFKLIRKRDYLSITPKVEDLKVVYKWIEKYNVPHYYVQVFFDKSYGISFKNILLLLTEPDKKGEYYEVSKDNKNQHKTTIKINTRKTTQVASKITEPEHISVRRAIDGGRLLYYVKFKDGTACLNIEGLKSLLNIEDF